MKELVELKEQERDLMEAKSAVRIEFTDEILESGINMGWKFTLVIFRLRKISTFHLTQRKRKTPFLPRR